MFCVCKVKEEEIVEGIEHKHESEHDDEHEHDEEHHHETDEHVWLSLRNAKALCGTIPDALCKIDPANSDMYKQNADSYIAKLTELDTQYRLKSSLYLFIRFTTRAAYNRVSRL